MRKIRTLQWKLLGIALLWSQVSLSETPWVLEEDQLRAGVIFVNESFTDKWLGDERSPIAEISQETVWLNIDYGWSERLELRFSSGYTQSEFDASDKSFSGINDTKFGAKYFVLNEYDESPLSLAITTSAIIQGSYERSSAGNPHSPGDKANALEVDIPFARAFGPGVAFGNIGYRKRFNDTPDDVFYSVGFGLSTTRWYGQIRYMVEDGRDGLTIGVPPFTPDNFHRTEEDRDILDISSSFTLNMDWSLYVGIADVLDGRNTGDSDIFYLGLSYTR